MRVIQPSTSTATPTAPTAPSTTPDTAIAVGWMPTSRCLVLPVALAGAMMDSSAFLAITGNVPSALIGKDAFQEIDITGITLPITKHNFLVQDPAAIPRTIAEAFHLATTGRPGPVLVDLPKDGRVTILHLSDKTCKWPIGDPGSEDFCFCGHGPRDGSPYCEYHARLAYQPLQDRRNRKVSFG